MAPLPRLFAMAAAAALALGALGGAWELIRFGWSDRSGAQHLEADVRRRVADDARQVEALARIVAGEAALVARATASRDQLSSLFKRVQDLAGPVPSPRTSATVYVPAGPAGGYRVLAWSDGPAQDLYRDRLAGEAALFLVPGALGPQLVALQPIMLDGRRVGVAAAETSLSRAGNVTALSAVHQMDTSFGRVSLIPHYAGAGENPRAADAFVIAGPDGTPLLEIHYSPAEITARRADLRRRAMALAAMPLIAALLLATGPLLDRRRRTRDWRGWLVWTGAMVVVVVAATSALFGLGRMVRLPAAAEACVLALGGLALAAVVGGAAWWHRWPRRSAINERVQFAIEQLVVGGLLATMVLGLARLLRVRITAATLDSWQFPLFPIEAEGLLQLVGLLVSQVAIIWVIASVLAFAAARWRLALRRPGPAIAAVVCWLVPIAALALAPGIDRGALAPAFAIAVATSLFALLAGALRHLYRHTTQAMRLLLSLAAMVVPLAVAYPLAAYTADEATRHVIEREYAPATATQPRELRAQLALAQNQIDRIPGLAGLLASRQPVDSQAAFFVWSQTRLSQSRVTSDVELYDRHRALVSRFALNVPEYVYRATAQTWSGTSCEWEVYGEVSQFGAEDRRMLHAERGVCDSGGGFHGAVVVHIALDDYQALPFVPNANPYYDVLGVSESQRSRIADLQIVVYGWSLRPLFTSGRASWALTQATFDRLYKTGEPFWQTVSVEGRLFHVHMSQDRSGVYALGYPEASPFSHAMRLAEMAAVMGAMFIVLLLGGAAYAPLARRKTAPLRVLFHEIRTSFYRKLFLFFVLAAVGPVLLFALAFGAYMTGKFRADVDSEAASVVTVARRVYEELSAAELRVDQATRSATTDDVMVWIRQVIAQEVNLFDGSELVATSQRDLFDSGLLPTRTPAALYRAIALNRLPTFVWKDQLGGFEYVLAAAPISQRENAVLSVPLASRQREIERQIDELNRGVLVGAVVVVLFAAGLGASVAGRVSDPVSRLTRATRLIAAGRLDVRIAADTADELRRLVDDFNSMAETLGAQRAALARTNQLKAWNEMARQVAHEIKNPLTPIQLATEHLQRVHDDQGQPLGRVFDQCVTTILGQVRLLRQIASEFANFAGEPTTRMETLSLSTLVRGLIDPYRLGLERRVTLDVDVPETLPAIRADRTLLLRALTNLVENALQAMPGGGTLKLVAREDAEASVVALTLTDTGVGMDETALARAFEPYFSTKTGGSGLGLANAKRNVEVCGGTIDLASTPGVGTRITVRLPVADLLDVPASALPPAR